MKIKREYKGYYIEFFIKGKVREYFMKQKVDALKLFSDDKSWFEDNLFKLIDDNCDGLPDEVYGKEFKIIFYEIIEKQENQKKTILKTDIEIDQNKSIETEITANIEDKFFVKYAILK